MNLAKAVVLVPHHRGIEPDCDDCLRALERSGVEVWRQGGCSAIDFARSDMASQALIQGRESMLFIDSDMVFRVEDALRLLGRPEPVVGGVYAQKEFNHKINAKFLPGVTEIPFGKAGKDFQVGGIGAGFLRIRREALLKLIDIQKMPCCTRHGGEKLARCWPFFLPLIQEEDDLQWGYNGEDYSFCIRCERAGIPVIADTTVLLGHIGKYIYTLEDAQRDPPELRDSFTIAHRDKP